MGLGKLSRIFNYESDAYLYHKIGINVDICTRALISVVPHDPCVTIWRCVYGLTLASLGRFAASRSEGPARAGRPYIVWQSCTGSGIVRQIKTILKQLLKTAVIALRGDRGSRLRSLDANPIDELDLNLEPFS